MEDTHDFVTAEDAKTPNAELGSHRAQQTSESLIVLVAMRLWKPYWFNKRVRLTVKSDSVAGLSALFKLQSHGDGPSLVARELALDFAKSTYTPAIVERLPGTANTIADLLSRLGTASQKGPLPDVLRGVLLRICPVRCVAFWRWFDSPCAR